MLSPPTSSELQDNQIVSVYHFSAIYSLSGVPRTCKEFNKYTLNEFKNEKDHGNCHQNALCFVEHLTHAALKLIQLRVGKITYAVKTKFYSEY